MGALGGPGGGAENAMDWSEAPRASCIEGSDWRTDARWESFSSPEVRRDSGGESKPPSEPGATLLMDDWRAERDSGCIGLTAAGADIFLWWSISSRFTESKVVMDGRPTLLPMVSETD